MKIVENARPATEPRNGPDLEFPRKIPKKYPLARNSGLPEFTPKIPRKYRKNTPKTPKMRIFGIFFGIFGVFSWGSRISARGVFFRYFSWKFWVGPSRGSVAGRGVLKKSWCSQRAQRAKKFEISSEIKNFEREWNFRASHPPRPNFLCGIQDVEIEIFERD